MSSDEARVTVAQRLLVRLGAALVYQPFDVETHERLRAWLADEAASVLASLEALRARPDDELRARVAELCGHDLRTDGAA
ncbi:hypothetical protein [Streptomyces sp. 8L]|uniref:hypothetical protein n=1 Tax=Streptomyces sp. 8L TaxID=2877242 RepID=UPI001CD7DAFD|nr:hypothetical protein [Streptomyces sp. 8L]MCA1219296.1 hypothetical protein [Streptomyces sp. 8L]